MLCRASIIFSFLYFTKCSQCSLKVDPIVETDLGLIKGVRGTDGEYAKFLGIPYATIRKDNPFGESIPHKGFESVFEANNESAVCPQYDITEKKAIGTLNCLHLNIFVPDTATSQNPVPVLIWIYGGGFERGNYQTTKIAPRFLMKHEIIVASFNYRTGPYGFMCLDTPEIPGNAGLKDQLLALKWIKSNIKSFGGDDNQVTLAGQSAGSVSVDFHLLFNKDIYYNKVILNSGTAQAPWSLIDSDKKEPIKIAELLGYNTDDLNDATSYLKDVDPLALIAAKHELSTVSRPCVEKAFDNVENFISDYPINVGIPRAVRTPMLIGYTDDELIGEYSQFKDEFFEDTTYFSSEMSLSFEFGDRANKMGDYFKHFYVGDNVGLQSKMEIIDFESDLRFNHPTQRTIYRYLEEGANQVYHFVFSYVGDRNLKLTNNVTIGGASHGDQVPYFFDYAIFNNVMSAKDQIMVNRMTTLYANFVKYGDPTPVTSDILPVKWTPVTNDSLNFLNIDYEMTMGSRPFHERLTFWDFFYKVYKKLQKGYREI